MSGTTNLSIIMSLLNRVLTTIPCCWSMAVSVAGIAIVLMLCSCRDDTGGERVTPGILHPTEENIPAVEDPRFVLREGDGSQPVLEFIGSPTHMIGISEGQQHAMIGSISDMEFRRRALYYADSEYGEIRVFDLSGALLAVVGNPGIGPGEFSELTRVAVMENEAKLAAWDRLSRVQVFSKQDSTYMLENIFHIVPNAYEGDICVVKDHLYAIGYSENLEGVIHKYTLAGDHVTSFGELYKSSFSLLKGAMSQAGRLECDEQLGIIAHVNHSHPILTGYSENGDIVWRVKFDDFRPAIVEEGLKDGAPSITYRPVQKGESGGYSLIRDQMTATLIARYHVKGDAAEEKSVSHYFGVLLQTGEGSYLGIHRVSSKDSRLVGLSAEHAYAVRYSPFPQIMIYERSEVQF